MLSRMESERIAELLEPFLSFELSENQLNSISIYIDILSKWNQRINLTAVRKPEEIVTRHFGESLFAAQHLFPSSAQLPSGDKARLADRRLAPETTVPGATWNEIPANALTVVDVGSGAGFPGLPIKIWVPRVRLILIESNHKKATFLKEEVRALGLEGVEVFVARAENFPVASADVVTLRAVERFRNILPVASGMVKTGGRLALLIGGSQIELAKSVTSDFKFQEPVAVPLSQNRTLLVGVK